MIGEVMANGFYFLDYVLRAILKYPLRTMWVGIILCWVLIILWQRFRTGAIAT